MAVRSSFVLREGELAEEEFEPLFDYRRVQPKFVCLDDDDSDEEPVFVSKRQKDGKGENDGVPRVIVCDGKKEEKEEEEEEDDWMPPPPKFDANAKRKLAEDPALKELRLMKQELQTFAQSTKDLLQSEEDSAKREVSSPSQSLKDASAELPKPQCERAKIVISIQDKDGPKQFRVFLDDKFERLFKLYADRVKLNLKNLVFTFDGEKISPSATPDSLGMEDEDIIEVHVKSS
ncbi:uncharacterized protein LOC115672011 isoform X1 [Syzygium oleosum]|uniref:uncharacterized protein LOC115672011 isoform X1 n=1 Tax=Syzygium oleosum TaxID=219896 RepID=UPI0024BA7EF8|nr:uncharacterized protein LOC115672011 isoform X1 [Syzygium oleosum]XP_056164631.1 uncharacterized protein LOC115672011 isoform X1 [Syzygium oleosum]